MPRRRKLLLIALVGYLALPFDLVSDFIPVAGQLDDAIIVALVLRHFIRAGGEPMMRELWPGPEQSLALILRLARPGPPNPNRTRSGDIPARWPRQVPRRRRHPRVPLGERLHGTVTARLRLTTRRIV